MPYSRYERETQYSHVYERSDGYYFYDPTYDADGPYPTPEIAQAALIYYMEVMF